jgi:hypothetical protein
MEPITLMVAALVAGAAAALQDSASDTLKSAYASLKSLLKRRLGGDALAQSVIDEHAQEPEVWARPLEARLVAAGVAEDEEIIRAAHEVLRLADPEGARSGKYNVQISGSQGVIVGDDATVTQNFHGRP